MAALQPRQQHAVLEPARLAWVTTLAEGGRPHVVLVLAVLAVQSCDDTTTGAPASSIVNSSSIIARWR